MVCLPYFDLPCKIFLNYFDQSLPGFELRLPVPFLSITVTPCVYCNFKFIKHTVAVQCSFNIETQTIDSNKYSFKLDQLKASHKKSIQN